MAQLTGQRRSFLKFEDASRPTTIFEDSFGEVGARKMEAAWKGRTEFALHPDANVQTVA